MAEDDLNKNGNRELEKSIPESKPRSKLRRFAFGFWILTLVALLVGVVGILVYKTGFTFSQMNVKINDTLPLAEDEPTPQPDPDRLNILVLGLRGEEDKDGGLLTDSMMVVSFKKSTGQVALISIPRDIYLTMPGEQYKEKINYAYALGYQKRNGAGGGLLYSKIAVSRLTGLYIDYAICVDHTAFREMVDILGGIDIYLERPFQEETQFAKEILLNLPAGQNYLNGTTTLYFVRSRFSTSDFDRSRRQQQVLLAIKDKALSLGILANPVKVFQLLDTLGRNVRTDMSLNEIKELVNLGQNADTNNIIHKVFDTTPEGLLYESRLDSGIYILLPQGDSFDQIQEACRNIFQ